MFLLTTDTSCDIPRLELDRLQIPWTPLTFTVSGQTFADDFSSDKEYKTFYDKVRTGAMPITSQISAYIHEEFFCAQLGKGATEIVHLTLSGGLSSTYASAVAGAKNALEKHPTCKIFVIDTLSATQGHRALLEDAILLRDKGMNGQEAAAELEKQKERIHHWIVVDDLMHLKRGGRVSGPAAYIGSMLKIKPVLIINNEGKLAVVYKAKGTAKAMNYVLEMMHRYAQDIATQTVYLASADATDKAEEMAKLITAEFGCKVVTGWIGPVIGAHTGAGTLGIVFKGEGRLNNK